MFVATLATALVQAEPVTKLSADDLADKLEAANVLLNRDFDTTFEYRVLKASRLNDERPWQADDWEFFESFRYVTLGANLYTERLVYERPAAAGLEPTAKYRQENIWADGTWALRVEGEQAVSFYAQPRPTDLQTKGFIFNLLEGRYPAYQTLADLVRTGTVLNQSVEDGVLSYRFARHDTPASRVQHVIRAQMEPAFVLLGYTTELSDSPTLEDFQRHVHLRNTYTVVEWQQVGELRIPRIAQIESFGSAKGLQGYSPPLSSMTFYTRRSFREILENEVDPELFTVPLPIGTAVYDDRIKLSFEIGNTYLSLDGTLYQLDEPIMEHPGDRLAEMIQNATPQHPPSGSSSLSTSGPGSAAVLEPTRSGLLRSRIVLAGLVGVGVALLTLAVIRARRAQRKAS